MISFERDFRTLNYKEYLEEIEKLRNNKSEYEWDELEELINDSFFDEAITSEEADELMQLLMDVEP
ncbi:MAG: hypothetical protein K6F77_00170 [Lachnospiraceae bacterium]|nr:hypothetical protein [Lachnospiraceae bacterium]